MKVLVSQIGAREHYAAAQSLHQQGLLAALVTDWYAFGKSGKRKAESRNNKKCSPLPAPRSLACGMQSIFHRAVLRCLSSVVRSPSAKAAHCDAIPDAFVRAFPLRSLFWKGRVRRLKAQGRLYEAYAQTDAAFARAVSRCSLPAHDLFFGYAYASLEMLAAEKKRGNMTVLCQIDPGPVHFRIVAEEMAQHVELACLPTRFPEAYFDRVRREWELADVIIVNSEWSRDAIVAEGAVPSKIEILPLAYEINAETPKHRPLPSDLRPPTSGPLRVLCLGQVTPGKGIHYLMQAARLLEWEPVHFDVVGSIGVSGAVIKSAPSNMRFHGAVSRDQAADWYRQSDVFVLPTLSDGFALTQLEAMAHGLPVIATPNCGRVVEEGKTGLIVSARDARALAGAILKFAGDRNLAKSMAPACREAVKAYSIEAYGHRLVAIIKKHRACSL